MVNLDSALHLIHTYPDSRVTAEWSLFTGTLSLKPRHVPLRAGPPTREELDAYYPPMITWDELKQYVAAG